MCSTCSGNWNKLGGSPTLGILDLVEPPWISLVGTFVDLGQPEAQVSGTVQRQPAGFAYSIQKDCGKRLKGSTAETPLLVTTYKMLQDWRFASFLYSTAQPKDVYADYLFTNDVAWLKGAIVLNVGWCRSPDQTELHGFARMRRQRSACAFSMAGLSTSVPECFLYSLGTSPIWRETLAAYFAHAHSLVGGTSSECC